MSTLFGRPGSALPSCPRGDCNQGRECDCGPAPVNNKAQWRACDWFCAVALVAVLAFIVILGG